MPGFKDNLYQVFVCGDEDIFDKESIFDFLCVLGAACVNGGEKVRFVKFLAVSRQVSQLPVKCRFELCDSVPVFWLV